jgi:DNA replication and repair protein RecF
MQQRSGDTPVLLLDDLLSELDAQRRAHLLQTIGGPGQQTLVTATDMSNFDSAFLNSATCLRVEEGRIYAP